MERVFHVFCWAWHFGEVINGAPLVQGLFRNDVLIRFLIISNNQVIANFNGTFLNQRNQGIYIVSRYVLAICARKQSAGYFENII